jgi:hypothetical protein
LTRKNPATELILDADYPLENDTVGIIPDVNHVGRSKDNERLPEDKKRDDNP